MLNKLRGKIRRIINKNKEDREQHQKKLLEKYNRGEILQVDGKTDNVAYLKSMEGQNGFEKSTE